MNTVLDPHVVDLDAVLELHLSFEVDVLLFPGLDFDLLLLGDAHVPLEFELEGINSRGVLRDGELFAGHHTAELDVFCEETVHFLLHAQVLFIVDLLEVLPRDDGDGLLMDMDVLDDGGALSNELNVAVEVH